MKYDQMNVSILYKWCYAEMFVEVILPPLDCHGGCKIRENE